jgi:hypothetical protein
VLKVHPATQTLIYKGSPEKLAVLTQVLDALKPKEPAESEKVLKLQTDLESTSMVKARLEAEIQRLDTEIAELHKENARVNSRLGVYVSRYGAGLPNQPDAKPESVDGDQAIAAQVAKIISGQIKDTQARLDKAKAANGPEVVPLQHELDLLNEKLKTVTTQPSK